MVGKGVVEALVATLAAVQGEGAPALDVQDAACRSLRVLVKTRANRVHLRASGWSHSFLGNRYVVKGSCRQIVCSSMWVWVRFRNRCCD